MSFFLSFGLIIERSTLSICDMKFCFFRSNNDDRQTKTIVSWSNANAVFIFSFVVIFVFGAWLCWAIDIRSAHVFWSVSWFVFFFFFARWGLERRFQLNGRRSTSFRCCRSEGEWKRRRTIVQVEKERENEYDEEEYFNWFSSSNFAVLLSNSWLRCLRREEEKKREKISSFSKINFLSFTCSWSVVIGREIGSLMNDEINICHILSQFARH